MRRIVYNKVFIKIMLTETVCLTLSSVTYSLVNNVWLGMHSGHSFFYSYQQNKVKSVVVGYHHLSMFRKFAVCTRSGNKIPEIALPQLTKQFRILHSSSWPYMSLQLLSLVKTRSLFLS